MYVKIVSNSLEQTVYTGTTYLTFPVCNAANFTTLWPIWPII